MSEQVVVLQAMSEYAQALRGDWSDFDGRSNRSQMEQFIAALEGGRGSNWSIGQWRRDMGVCPAGLGHWSGGWGYCDESCGDHDWAEGYPPEPTPAPPAAQAPHAATEGAG